MHHSKRAPRILPPAALLGLLLVASLLLAACGSSSSPSKTSTITGTTTTSTGPSASTSTPGSTTATSTQPTSSTGQGSSNGSKGSSKVKPGADSPLAKRFAQLRRCLTKNGASPPRQLGGKRASAAERAKYQSALQKCGGISPTRLRSLAASPKEKEALTQFAECMRRNGINLPAPNTSGKGPVFNTSHLGVGGSKFKTVERKCAVKLRADFPRRAHPGGSSAGGPAQ